MRLVTLGVMTALALAAILLPDPSTPQPGSEAGVVVPPVSICPIVEAGERHTTISVLSSVRGHGRISTFSSGSATGSLVFSTGGSGSVSITAADVSAIGLGGGLIELPSAATVSGVTIAGAPSLAAESCAETPTSQSYLMGGSTAGSASFDILLMNPYAGEAVVDLTVSTDTGLESDSRFDAVIVPALSTITLNFNEIIPGRAFISASIVTTRGSVLAVASQTTAVESAIWRAVAPAQNWWLPVPAGGDVKELVIGSATNTEVEYRIDYYGPEGLVEEFAAGTIEPRRHTAISLTSVTTGASGIRVFTTAPVVAGLSIDALSGLAVTTGSPIDALTWLLPGANSPAGGSASIVVLNTGIEPVTVAARSLREESLIRNFELAAEAVLVIDLVAADGYRIEASGPVVALWTSQLGGAGAAAIGVPIQDG
ncbi:MAG TPA: DUF5719 family protein [Acidimicrobiia bacterium]